MNEEICEECIGIIGLAEQAYVYEGRIVCEQCDRKLRQGDRQYRISPDAEDTWKAQQPQEFPDAEDTWKTQQPPESPGAEDTWKAQEVKESPATEDTWQAKKSEEFVDSVESQEQKEPLEVQELKESEEPQEARAPEEFEIARESEEIFELLQRQESEELGELKESEEPGELKEPEESTAFQETIETEEPIDAPVESEETAEMPEVDSAKALPRKRKRVITRESKLLPILLVAWSLITLFLLFYVPDRYAEILSNIAFGGELQLGGFADDCLIIFFMVLWFFGALGLYAGIIGSEKDERIDEKLRILRLLGF